MFAASLVTIALALQPPAKSGAPPAPKAGTAVAGVGINRTYTVTLQPLPTPLLRYRLARPRLPGDAYVYYLQAYAAKPRLGQEEYQRWEKLDEQLSAKGALGNDDRKFAESILARHADALRMIERGVARDRCDWSPVVPPGLELDPNVPGMSSLVGPLLPNVQMLRDHARLLGLRIRLAVIDRRFDAAIDDIARMKAMAGHVAEGPTLIQLLVAIAIDAIANGHLRELAEAVGPNLLPALIELPADPFRAAAGRAVRREVGDLVGILPPVAELDARPLTEAEAAALVKRTQERYARSIDPSELTPPKSDNFLDRLLGPVKPLLPMTPVAEARKQLASDPNLKDRLGRFPDAQVQLLAMVHAVRRDADPVMLVGLRPGHPLAARPKIRPTERPPTNMTMYFNLMAPAVDKVGEAVERSAVEHAGLELAEAMRAELARGQPWGEPLLKSPLVAATLDRHRLPTPVWDTRASEFTVVVKLTIPVKLVFRPAAE